MILNCGCKHRNRPWDQGENKVRNRLKHIRTFLASIFDERFAARFYDTAGLDSQQREVPKHLLAAADGFVIVYSVEDKQSFILAEAIRKEIKNCGEKRDNLVSESKIPLLCNVIVIILPSSPHNPSDLNNNSASFQAEIIT